MSVIHTRFSRCDDCGGAETVVAEVEGNAAKILHVVHICTAPVWQPLRAFIPMELLRECGPPA